MTPPPPPRRKSSPSPAARVGTHSTQVFGGEFPSEEVAELAKAASAAGDGVILLLQKSRLAGAKRRLARTPGITFLDTQAAIDAMSSKGRLVPEKVGTVLGAAIEAAGKGRNGNVAVFTDAAGTLVLAKREADSRILENLCHGVCRSGPVFLMCVYPVAALTALNAEDRQDYRTEHHLAA